MSFRDWSDDMYDWFHDESFRTIFNEIEGIYYLNEDDQIKAEELFEAGWLDFDATEDMRESARNDFLDLVGLADDRELWAEWRELYDEADG
jgi:hypothetical protein